MANKDESTFRVTDTRASSNDTMEGGAASDQPELEQEEQDEAVPPIDFTTFVLSLSTSALMQLGEIAEPGSRQGEANLGLARQTIDLLSLLEQKTKGNLTGDEERLLTHVLFDLRMRFVEKTQAKK